MSRLDPVRTAERHGRRVSVGVLAMLPIMVVVGLLFNGSNTRLASPASPGNAGAVAAVCGDCAADSLDVGKSSATLASGAPGIPWLFDTSGFPARWQCGEWPAVLGWMHIASDTAIWGAYMAIPVVLGFFVLKGRVPVPHIGWLFIAFIGACGIGHLLEAVIFWHPVYRLAGAWKVVTACVSWLTVAALVPLVPRVLRLPTLEETNRRLEAEIQRREHVERDLSSTNHLLSFQKQALDEHAIVAITDARGVITYVNEKFCEISGYTPSELIGQTHKLVNSGVHPRAFFVALWRRIASGQVWRGEICNRAKDGHLYWVDTTIVPFTNEEGHPTQYIAIRADVTARKRYEERLAMSVEDLRSKGAELDRKNRELEQFTYSASHDLKSPLVAILGYCECLTEDIERRRYDSLGQYASRISRNVEQLRATIDDLLELSRVGRVEEGAEWVPLDPLADEVLEVFADRIAEPGVTVSRVFGAPAVFAQRERLKQVLQNLIENALRYGRGEDSLRIEMGSARQNGETVVWVRDNGAGIAPEYHECVFQLFKRLSPGSEGTGVGLAIVKRVAETHHGRAWVESELGQGACFRVSFPDGPAAGEEVNHDAEVEVASGAVSPG